MAARALQLGGGTGEDGVLLALGRGVHQQAGRLVDHQHVGIAMKHLEGWRPWRPREPREIRPVLDHVVRTHRRPGVDCHNAVEEDVPDEHLALGVREGRAQQLLRRPAEPSCRLLHRVSVAPLAGRLWTAPRLPG